MDNNKTITDTRDGQTYRTVELNGLLWMAENLNFKTPEGSWFYEDKPENGEKYGRLYTWEAAKKACPPGWRLPTDEEWRGLAMAHGGVDEDASDGGKAAYEALIDGGSSGFGALLGGWQCPDGSFAGLGASGNYWSLSTTRHCAWYYFFYEKLYRYNIDKEFRFSCRYVTTQI